MAGLFSFQDVLYHIVQFLYMFISALHKAGKHMENSIVAAYVALLVGCLIQENQVSILSRAVGVSF